MPGTSTEPMSRAMIDRLISFDTTSRDSNLHLISFVEKYLKDLGIESTLIHNEDRSKANLFATIGPAIEGGVVLSGHTDVVPVDGQNWSTDPFVVAETEKRLFGRGTADMKSFIAVALSLAPEMNNANLSRPIHFAFSFDEEVGCLGVGSMIEHMINHVPMPRAVIVGEPTMMKVINAHKGIRSFRTTVTGLEAHSSQQQIGVNAIVYTSKLIGFLNELSSELKDRGDTSGRFEPGYTTIQIGTIEGGTAVNIIPHHCTFGWEYRWLPDHDADEIWTRFQEEQEAMNTQLRGFSAECSVETVQRAFAPGLKVDSGSDAESLVLALTGKNETEAVSYATEAGLFQEASVPTVVCGPGDIKQAHKPDEFIDIDQIVACEAFVRKLINHMKG